MGKTFGAILLAQAFWQMPYLAASCIIVAAFSCWLMLYTLSLAMRYYDNIDVIPMLQSFILLMMLVAGWVVLGEI